MPQTIKYTFAYCVCLLSVSFYVCPLPLSLSVCLSACLPTCLCFSPSVSLSVCLSHTHTNIPPHTSPTHPPTPPHTLSLSQSACLSVCLPVSPALRLTDHTEPSRGPFSRCAGDRVASVLPPAVLARGRADNPQGGRAHRQQVTSVPHQAPPAPEGNPQQVRNDVVMLG